MPPALAIQARPNGPQAGPALNDIRHSVRALLTSADGFRTCSPEDRTTIAHSLVKIAAKALELETHADSSATPLPPAKAQGIARALDAGDHYSGVSADRVADTTRRILNAVSFPRFVNDLLIGVFKALMDTNQQQMQAYVDLIKAVASTTDGFADANFNLDGARRWLADRFPANFVIESLLEPGDQPEEGEPTVEIQIRPGAAMPSEAALRSALSLGPQDPVPSGNPESVLPLVRSALAKNRQQMLATMIMLGMQRIVIDSGRIHAAMRFHIDTRSAAQEETGSSFDFRHEDAVSASATFGPIPIGASASIRNSIGYVSTQRDQSSEEMNTDLDLNSSVELIFKTDYVPLDRLATGADANRIRVNSINPDAEERIASDERRARLDAQRAHEAQGRQQLNDALRPPGSPAMPVPQAPPPAPASGRSGDAGGSRSTGTAPASTTPQSPATAPAPAPGRSADSSGSPAPQLRT